MNVNEASRLPIVECAVQPLLQRLESYHQLAKNSAVWSSSLCRASRRRVMITVIQL